VRLERNGRLTSDGSIPDESAVAEPPRHDPIRRRLVSGWLVVVASRVLRLTFVIGLAVAGMAATVVKYRHDYLISVGGYLVFVGGPPSRWDLIRSWLVTTWPICLWVTLVSVSILLFSRHRWRYFAALWCIATAAAVIYLDRAVIPASPRAMNGTQGFVVNATLLTQQEMAQQEIGTITKQGKDIILGRPELALTLDEVGRVSGSFKVAGDGIGYFVINLPPGTKVASTTLLHLQRIISNDKLTSVQFSVGPKEFLSEFRFEWDGHVSDPTGIARWLYHVSYRFTGPLASEDPYRYPGTYPRLTIELPDQHRQFLELNPPATTATRFQSRSWDLVPSEGGADIDAIVVNPTLRLFVDYAVNLLFLGFGFFLGALNASQTRNGR
jgi:hypothetical protein